MMMMLITSPATPPSKTTHIMCRVIVSVLQFIRRTSSQTSKADAGKRYGSPIDATQQGSHLDTQHTYIYYPKEGGLEGGIGFAPLLSPRSGGNCHGRGRGACVVWTGVIDQALRFSLAKHNRIWEEGNLPTA